MTIAMIAMSWKGFPYIMAIIAIYLGFQMLINAFRRVDSLTTGMLGLVTLGLPVLLSYPYYQTMGFINTWWEAPAYILLGYIIMSLLMVGSVSLNVRPNRICAGDSLQPGSGVFLCVSKARTILSFSRSPFGLMLFIRRRLVIFTASSALPFEDGKLTDASLCLTPHRLKKSCVSLAMNSGPPSLDISIGTPNVTKSLLKAVHNP